MTFKETPTYNPRRRKSVMSVRHSMSSSTLDASSLASSSTTGSSGTPSPTLVYSTLGARSAVRRSQQPSPSPSSTERWLDLNPLCLSSASVRSDTGSSSSCTGESEDNASANGSSLTGTRAPAHRSSNEAFTRHVRSAI